MPSADMAGGRRANYGRDQDIGIRSRSDANTRRELPHEPLTVNSVRCGRIDRHAGEEWGRPGGSRSVCRAERSAGIVILVQTRRRVSGIACNEQVAIARIEGETRGAGHGQRASGSSAAMKMIDVDDIVRLIGRQERRLRFVRVSERRRPAIVCDWKCDLRRHGNFRSGSLCARPPIQYDSAHVVRIGHTQQSGRRVPRSAREDSGRADSHLGDPLCDGAGLDLHPPVRGKPNR